MSVQGLINTAIGAASGAVSRERGEVAEQAAAAPAAAPAAPATKKVKGMPDAKAVQTAQKAATEQVKTRAGTIAAANETLSNQAKMASGDDRAETIRQMREAGYISGRQARRVLYNLQKGTPTT